MKHKNYDVIIAWANGEKIEYYNPKSGWIDVYGACPNFNGNVKFRIKQIPQDFAITAHVLHRLNIDGKRLEFDLEKKPNVEFYFDGETQQLTGVELLK
jgi:hypothetical protein